MKTQYFIPEIIRPAIVAHYSEARAVQIERACNGARQDPKTVSASSPDMKRGDMSGGMSLNQKGKLSLKSASWSETEKVKYTVEQSTAPIEFVKFTDSLVALYRRCGSKPSGEIGVGSIPSYCREWIDGMHAKAEGTDGAVKKINRNRKNQHAKDKAPDNTPAPESASNGVPA